MSLPETFHQNDAFLCYGRQSQVAAEIEANGMDSMLPELEAWISDVDDLDDRATVARGKFLQTAADIEFDREGLHTVVQQIHRTRIDAHHLETLVRRAPAEGPERETYLRELVFLPLFKGARHTSEDDVSSPLVDRLPLYCLPWMQGVQFQRAVAAHEVKWEKMGGREAVARPKNILLGVAAVGALWFLLRKR